MRNEILSPTRNNLTLNKEFVRFPNLFIGDNISTDNLHFMPITEQEKPMPEILFITSYPPRECGIATYSQDLIKALNDKFSHSFSLKVCALDSENEKQHYPAEVKYIIEPSRSGAFSQLAKSINHDKRIEVVLIQHEFGLFYKNEAEFNTFLSELIKPVIVVFHTVLPNPDNEFKAKVKYLTSQCASVIVMTHNSAKILMTDYQITEEKIAVIPHGTHLVPHLDKKILKEKYKLRGRKIFSTFGLLSAGKCIETTLAAMPEIIKVNPEALFLIIGKTHPHVVKNEGEKYRDMLQAKVEALGLQNHVKFINEYLPLPKLLEYLQLTDIYVFTSKDPNQAVSGTFSYAMSCGCAIISTPIPHAREVLGEDAGIIVDFENVEQLANAVNRLLSDNNLKEDMSSKGLHKIICSAWENTAVAHAMLFNKMTSNDVSLRYNRPEINLNHIKRLTTDFGMIQFSKINCPDLESGYTIDDNARALIGMCQHYELTGEEADLEYINTYFNFIKYCQQSNGNFLNYVDSEKAFTEQNYETNLEDANGRTIWALGYMISKSTILPNVLIAEAEAIIQKTLPYIQDIHSTRAMAFIIKGLHYANKTKKSAKISDMISTLADRLVQMFRHESEQDWQWFESYLTYANSLLSEALLCAYIETGEVSYKIIAISSFDFLLSIIFKNKEIKVISNQGWQLKGKTAHNYGEQAIDVAYTILALSRFYDAFKDKEYLHKMEIAFDWFLGNNHLRQTIYNPCTGGCYDGLEEKTVNLNQGAESTVSYLMSRLTVEKYISSQQKQQIDLLNV